MLVLHKIELNNTYVELKVGPFSVLSEPTSATESSFCSICQALHYHSILFLYLFRVCYFLKILASAALLEKFIQVCKSSHKKSGCCNSLAEIIGSYL